MNVAIISDSALARTHGTGAQILKVFGPSGLPFVHFYFYTWASGPSEVTQSYALENPHHKDWGRRLAARVSRAVGTSWWQDNVLNDGKIRRLLQSENVQCDVAYVVVGSEESAQRAVALLRYLDCPYIVHLMDLYHQEGFDQAQMPGVAKLLRGASDVFALNEAIKEQVERVEGVRADIVLFGREPMEASAQAPGPGETVRVVTVGRPYSGGMKLLEESLSALQNHTPKIEVSYVGPYFEHFPQSLRRVIRNHGFVSDGDYERILTESHLAFLTGPSELDHLGRFSIPSRMSDYFMAGLPVLACVAPETATEKMLQPLVPRCVRWTRTPTEWLNAISAFTAAPLDWSQASREARDFAYATLNIEEMRRRIVEALSQAAQDRETPKTVTPGLAGRL